jgi:flagellar L-ring protein precursor FlgH
MQRLSTLIGVSVVVAGLSGCAQLPRKSVVSDYEPVHVADPPARRADGSIFQRARGIQPLFEDVRPRMPGDLLTIVLNEEVSASKNSESSANRSGSTGLEVADIELLEDNLSELQGGAFSLSGDNDFSGGGDSQASNQFTGTITVTVVEVMPNGNLRVRGEKQIAINQGIEYIRFSGVVNPRTITGRNTVPSTSVADARIEYVGDGYIDEAQHMGWLQRFFLNVSPL